MRAQGASWTGRGALRGARGVRRAGTLGLCAGLGVLLACAGPPGARAPDVRGEAGSGALADAPERTVRGTGGYTLALPAGWSRQAPDAEQVGVDLSFVRENGSAWLLALPVSGATLRLDAMAMSRRAALLAAGATSYREERYLPGGATDRVASLARYAAGGEVILVLTTVRPPFGVEVVAGASARSGLELELREILESVALEPPVETGGDRR